MRVRVPPAQRRARNSPSSLQVPKTVATALAREFALTISPHILRWAAQQATLLSPRSPKAGERGRGLQRLAVLAGEPPRKKFLQDLPQIFDYARVALQLSGKPSNYKASRLELTRLSGETAWRQAQTYHQLLASIRKGKLPLDSLPPSAPENPYFLGAMLGKSPGALRALNGPRNLLRLVSKPLTGNLVIAEPIPLKHRHEIFSLPKGRAWIWVHPSDKERLGAGYGWCLSGTTHWRNQLQFAIVTPDNRPQALLTIEFDRAQHQDMNRYIVSSPGRARLDYAKIHSERARPYYGQIKGRYNERPPPEPYRKDVIRWLARQPFGPLRVKTTHTAPADWTSLLTEVDDIPASKRNWKAAGGAAAVFAVADVLPITTRGEGAAEEATVRYFSAGARKASLAKWLKTPLAPLVLSALGTETARQIAPALPAKLLAERARVSARQLKMGTEGWVPKTGTLTPAERGALQDTLLARRSGVSLPTALISRWRERMARVKSIAETLSKSQVRLILTAQKRTGEFGDDFLAAFWRLYSTDPEALVRMPGVIRTVGFAMGDEGVNAILCEMISDGLLLGRSRAEEGKTKARAALVEEMAEVSTEVAKSPAPIELLERVYGEEDHPEGGRMPGDLQYYDMLGNEIVPGTWPLASALAYQSEPGAGSFHCVNCAGISTDHTDSLTGERKAESHPFGAGVHPSCFTFLSLFYTDAAWEWVQSISTGLETTVMRWAIAPYPVSNWDPEYEANIEYDAPSYVNLDGNWGPQPLDDWARGHIILALGLLRHPDLSDAHSEEEITEAGLRLKAGLKPTQVRLLKNLHRMVVRAAKTKVLPLTLWSRIEGYQSAWDEHAREQGP